jgi:cell division protein FtsI (penicillin-binding protein 3)
MNTRYKVRTAAVFFLFCSSYFIIIATLYTIQIKRRNFYLQLGQQQYNVTVKQHPPRGLIYDCNNNFLALNHDTLSAFILPNQLEKIEQLEPFLRKNFPQALQRLHANPIAQFMYVKRKLTDQELTLLEESKVVDIKLLKEPSRYYPVKAMGPIIGITDIDNNGLFGIELMHNNYLAGSPSTFCLQKDARSGHFYFKKETMVEGTGGQPITLTIDSDLQFLVFQELKRTVQQFAAQEGSVFIVNPTSGDILAMVSYPTFDPNNTSEIDLEKTKNKIITQAYEPGSVMKAFAALALLEEGLVHSDELVDCENSTVGFVNGSRFTTVKAHGEIPFAEVIQHSNNIGIAKMAMRLGPLLYDHYVRLGFGKKVPFDWPGQQAGFVNPPRKWSRSSLVSLSFGYEIRATLLQLAQAFAIIANGGKVVPCKYIKNSETNCEEITPHLYSPHALRALQSILEKTVAKQIPGYTIWGKTGTANMVLDGEYAPDHNIYTFVGIIQKDDYKRLIVTFIKDAQRKDLRAATVAVPLFDRIVHDLLMHETMMAKGITS